jgi:hypothetical protein
VIATKAGYDAWDRPPDFSAAAILRSAEGSLARLRTDYIDLFQLHNAPREALEADDVREVLSGLQKAGKIRAWGISAKSPVEAIEGLALGAPVIQANFNMMDVRAVTSGLLDDVRRRQAGFIGRTPLCFGFLSGAIRRDTVFPPGDHRLGWERAQLDNWIDGASELLAAVHAAPGAEGARSALRFCLAFEGHDDSGNPHPLGGRGERPRQRSGAAPGRGRRCRAADQSPAGFLRRARPRFLSEGALSVSGRRWPERCPSRRDRECAVPAARRPGPSHAAG